jgi:AhpD family alkylhydroperoxidase
VALLTDEEIAAASAAAASARTPEAQRGGLGLGLANSQRAMLRVPALAAAWRAVTAAAREGEVVGRDIKLQVSFAVSMANGCRYCTLHQVLGLRRLGVEPAKLVSMKKDDSALTRRELVAVTFARKLTEAPASVTDADFAALVREFGERGALEVVLQTCTFAFMNRFTDGLRLPSEDEAVRVYQELYGTSTL